MQFVLGTVNVVVEPISYNNISSKLSQCSFFGGISSDSDQVFTTQHAYIAREIEKRASERSKKLTYIR